MTATGRVERQGREDVGTVRKGEVLQYLDFQKLVLDHWPLLGHNSHDKLRP